MRILGVAPGLTRGGAFSAKNACTARPYLVKINFVPAIRRTVARKSEIARTARCLLPRCDPMVPPMIAAAARKRPSEGIERTFVKYPTSPAIEFTQMNSAETAAACRMCAHRQNSNNGVRNIPPPVPVSPERNPRPAPALIATGREGVTVCGGSPRRNTSRAAEKSSTTPIKIRRTEADG